MQITAETRHAANSIFPESLALPLGSLRKISRLWREASTGSEASFVCMNLKFTTGEYVNVKRSTARSQDCLAGRLCAWVLSQFNLGVGYERFMSGVKDAALSGWVCVGVCVCM